MTDQLEPLLGLATTKELLDEVATRMEITQNSIKGRELGAMCREAIANLDAGILRYRTVNSGPPLAREGKSIAQSNRAIIDLSDPLVRDMVRHNHSPTELWANDGTLLSVECITCHNAWPCLSIKNLQEKWSRR